MLRFRATSECKNETKMHNSRPILQKINKRNVYTSKRKITAEIWGGQLKDMMDDFYNLRPSDSDGIGNL